MARRSPDDVSPDETAGDASHVHRSAVASCGIAVAALVAAIVLYASAGPPYGVNIGGGALYLLGLLAGLTGGVLLWLDWAELREAVSPGRLRWGVTTASASVVAVCVCVVLSLSGVASGTTQLVAMGVTALVVLVGAVSVSRA